MAKKKNGKNKGKITRDRNKVLESIRAQERMEQEKRIRQSNRRLDPAETL